MDAIKQSNVMYPDFVFSHMMTPFFNSQPGQRLAIKSIEESKGKIKEDHMKRINELIKERNRELDLAHHSMTANARKEHREKVNQINEQIRAKIRATA